MGVKRYFNKALVTVGVLSLILPSVFLLMPTEVAHAADSASISGTVLIDGVVPAEESTIEVLAYDLDEPIYATDLPANGPPILDPNTGAGVSTVDGTYTLTDLVEGHHYKLLVNNYESPTIKPTWYGNVSRSGLSDAIIATGDLSGIDFNVPAADGTHITGVTSNNPVGVVIVFAAVIDPDMWVLVGQMMAFPNGPYDNLVVLADLYHDAKYRVGFAGLDSMGEESHMIEAAFAFYNNLTWASYSCADLVLGNATGIDMDYSKIHTCPLPPTPIPLTPTITGVPYTFNAPMSNTESTEATPPAQPQNLILVSKTSNTANISWEQVTDATDYILSYGTNTDASNIDEVTLTGQINTTYTITKLKPGTTYYVKVRAKVGETLGEWSNIISFKTSNNTTIISNKTPDDSNSEGNFGMIGGVSIAALAVIILIAVLYYISKRRA